MQSKTDLLNALLAELQQRKDYLQGQTIQTIYFGGGTPSILEEGELRALMAALQQHFTWSDAVEITLEANPDDLHADVLQALKNVGINRLSIGIQSFYDEELQFMNRAHNAQQAKSAIQLAQAAGFQNITADLIYGMPTLTDEKWLSNLQQLTAFGIPHISAYCLTVEPGTALGHWVKTGKIPEPDDAQAARQFQLLMDDLSLKGYEHYEISNFALPGQYSRHNSSYWQGAHYLGLGPGAHSFDGNSRQWNVANNATYLRNIASNQPYFEREELSKADRFNEYIMTGLRTKWGCSLEKIQQDFGPKERATLETQTLPLIQAGDMIRENNILRLTNQGKLRADGIASELFL